MDDVNVWVCGWPRGLVFTVHFYSTGVMPVASTARPDLRRALSVQSSGVDSVSQLCVFILFGEVTNKPMQLYVALFIVSLILGEAA